MIATQQVFECLSLFYLSWCLVTPYLYLSEADGMALTSRFDLGEIATVNHEQIFF